VNGVGALAAGTAAFSYAGSAGTLTDTCRQGV